MTGPPDASRIAVIGGGGFIGRRLVARLVEQGASVRVIGLTRPAPPIEAEWLPGDVRDTDAMASALRGMDLLYNLAAAHGLADTPADAFHDVNVNGARAVCRAAAVAGVGGIIFTSTAAVYGHGARPDEDVVPRPNGAYGTTKLAAEQVYRAWLADNTQRTLTIVRPTVVFGPGGEGTGGRLLRHIAGPGFRHAGLARNRKSLAFVDNLAAFLAHARTLPGGARTFNYADQPDLEVASLARIVRSALGLPAAPHRLRLAAFAGFRSSRDLSTEMRFNASRAHASGFIQPVGLPEALELTARADLGWVALLSRARA